MSIRWARRKTKKIIRWVRDNFEIAIPMTIVIVIVTIVGIMINGLATGHW